MLNIERRPLHPNNFPTTSDGAIPDGWCIVYRGGGNDDTPAGRMIDGRIENVKGRTALRMVAADSARMRFAMIDFQGSRFVLGAALDSEIGAIAAMTLEAAAEPVDQYREARAKAAELGIEPADIAKGKKAELLELARLIDLVVDAAQPVDLLRKTLMEALF